MTESLARQVLELMGGTVTEIPTSSAEESDWLATFDGFDILIEEKTKFENPEASKARVNALQGDAVHGTVASLGPDKRIAQVLHKAAKQLRSSGAQRSHGARVVWFNAVGFDREAKDFQAFNTLYGATKVFDMDVSASLQDCYFFHHSYFFSHRDVDGAVLAVLHGQDVSLRLCLNPYSDRWQALKASPFAARFPRPIDPIALEVEGLVMLADTGADRNDPGAVLQYLREEYNVPRLQQMNMNIATAVVRVPQEGG